MKNAIVVGKNLNSKKTNAGQKRSRIFCKFVFECFIEADFILF